MTKPSKYVYLWVVQGHYAPGYGWEDVTCEESFKDARQRIWEYRENEPHYSHRLIQHRELREAVA